MRTTFIIIILAIAMLAAGKAMLAGLDTSQRKLAEALERLDNKQRNLVETMERLAPREFDDLAVDAPSASVEVTRAEPGPLVPVSLAKVAPDLWLIANYRNVYAFNPVKRVAVPIKPIQEVQVWNPSGIHYSSFYDRLFIANYTGKDILIAKIERDNDQVSLRLDARIAQSESIQGPEGVNVSPGGRYMAVADYVGNAVVLFERVDGEWKFRWKQPVLASHGVSIVADHVYAAGKVIAKFELETGKEIKRVSTVGERAILFATCINRDEKSGGLIASDTMAGRVFTLTRHLELKEDFGANGPGYGNLSMPYCAYRDTGGLTILSTYQDRILSFDDGIGTSYQLGQRHWRYLSRPIRYWRDMWSGTIRRDSPSYRMFGLEVRPSYGSLVASDGTVLNLPDRNSVFTSNWPFYVVSMAQQGDWIAIVSNSTPTALLYQKSTGVLGWSEMHEWDCWAMAAEILCPGRPYAIDELVAHARMAHPGGDLDAIAASLGVTPSRLLDEFTSPLGKKLLATIEQSHNPQSAVAKYRASVQGEAVSLTEYWLAMRLAEAARPAR